MPETERKINSNGNSGNDNNNNNNNNNPSILNIALRYHSAGIAVIPVSSPNNQKDKEFFKAAAGKAPKVKGWQKVVATEELINKWFSENSLDTGVRSTRSNLGVVCGQRSGIVVVDIDVKNGGMRWFLENEDRLGYCLKEITGSGGYHLYYRYPAGADKDFIPSLSGRCGLAPGVEIKADGEGGASAFQVVTWPSVHVSGRRYEFESCLSLLDLEAEADELPNWILEEIEKVLEVTRGKAADGNLVTETDSGGCLGEGVSGGVAVNDPAELERAKMALGKLGVAVSGEGGDLKTYRACCLGSNYGISKEVWAKEISGWNKGCVPPWDKKDLIRKLNAAYDRNGNSFGYRTKEKEFMEEFKDLNVNEKDLALYEKKKRKKKGNNPKNKKEEKDALPEDYFQLFHEHFGQLNDLRRDIFSEEVMYLSDKHTEGKEIWVPAVNSLGEIRSKIQGLRAKGHNIVFKKHDVIDHFEAFKKTLTKRIIPDIPSWDGRDRVQELAACVSLREAQELDFGFPPDAVEHIFKFWLAGVFRRIDDPTYQNRCMILIGNQGLGKETLIRALVGGFGQWACDFVIARNERDNLTQLNDAAVLFIGEFDRTSKTEVSLLKHIITADHTNVRAAYERKAAYRPCRCSFICSSNITDIFRDFTGNRRYLPLEIEKITWSYPINKEHRLQVLAQARHLAGTYEFPGEYFQAVTRYLADKTPNSPAQDCAEAWFEAVSLCLARLSAELSPDAVEIRDRGWVTNTEISEHRLIETLVRMTGFRERYCRTLLKNEGLEVLKRLNGVVQRGFLIRPKTISPLSIIEGMKDIDSSDDTDDPDDPDDKGFPF